MGGIELVAYIAIGVLIALVVLQLKGEEGRERLSQRLTDLGRTGGGRPVPRWRRLLRTIRARIWTVEFAGCFCCALAVVVLLEFLALPHALCLLAGIAGFFVCWILVARWQLYKMRKEFAERFPDAVDALTRAVQAGVPIEKALAAVGETYEGELGKRFTTFMQQLELGMSFRQATQNFARDLRMPDVDFFCAVLVLNRESGSRITPMLISLSKVLRQRRSVGRKLLVLTAETRQAAKIFSMLPFFVLGVMFFINPSSFYFLISDPTGRAILGVCLGIMLTGIVVINVMSRLGGNQ